MLTLVGRGGANRRRRPAQLDRLVYHIESTHSGMIDRGRHVQVLHLRIGEHLVHRIDRTARTSSPVQQFNPVRARVGRGDFRYCGIHLDPVLRPPGSCREPLIGDQVREADGVAEPFVHASPGYSDIDVAIGGRKHPGRYVRRMIVPRRSRNFTVL